MHLPVLYIVIPCYNEQEVLPKTAPLFLAQLQKLMAAGKIRQGSRLLFVDDGSKDNTRQIIENLSQAHSEICGISLSRNRGHQNALVAGMLEALPLCDAVITADCDGQDDITATEKMIDAYLDGCDIVYGVRSNRKSDTWFKRSSAQLFYKLMGALGVESVYNHADYRLLSRRALEAFSCYEEVNLYLRGMFPLVGFKSTAVTYDRVPRLGGETHYPLSKMLRLAFDGITSLSVKPLHLIATLGGIVSLIGFAGLVWLLIRYFLSAAVADWAVTVCAVCFLSGIQLLSLGVLGEYIGKMYMEVKRRPRYTVAEKFGIDEKEQL